MTLLIVSIAPIITLLVYVYYRDKYEKEPLSLLIKGVITGMIITIPIIFAEKLIGNIFMPKESAPLYAIAFFDAFMVAALCEEAFKFLAVYMLIWRNPNFNEKFDGIVYAVFVSLGFALVENILYVTGSGNGITVGITRAFTAVPAHAMFGVLMGYYMGMAKFSAKESSMAIQKAFVVPFLFHGIYDFILMSRNPLILILFFPFLISLLVRARKKMKELINISRFNPKNHDKNI